VQLELMDSNIRIRACAGLADHESAAVETRDITHSVRIWNGFSEKASSLRADMHGILANLLGLSATEVFNIPASQRMKSICASYGILPIQMLFTLYPSEPRSTTESGTPYMEAPNVFERWIPDFPDERGMFQGSAFPGDFGMRATSDGFHIQSSECMVLLKLDRSPSWLTRGHRRRILWTAQNSDPESSIDTDLSIYVAASSKARLTGLESQTQPVLVLIEGLPLKEHHTLSGWQGHCHLVQPTTQRTLIGKHS
jgi:hypothetical protein